MAKQDPAGDVFKAIEKAYELRLPEKTFMVIRIDGRAFHTWCRGLNKPYDTRMIEAMNRCTERLCANVSGALAGYVQSDEISIVASDLRGEGSTQMFGGRVVKIASVVASMATVFFNEAAQDMDKPPANFDARVFPLNTLEEVVRYMGWRQQDAGTNAVSMLAEHMFGSKAVHKMPVRDRVAKLIEAGNSPRNHPELERGRLITRQVDDNGRSHWETAVAGHLLYEFKDVVLDRIPDLDPEHTGTLPTQNPV